MLKYAVPTFALLLSAACRSTPPAATPLEFWRAELEGSQEDLQRELAALHFLLAAGAPQPMGLMELWAGIVKLTDRLDQLEALCASAGSVQVASAAFSSSLNAAESADAPPEIDALQEGLIAVQHQRTIHCENIANASTPGYKRRALHSMAILHGATDLRVPEITSGGVEMEQGDLRLTGNQLDFGIEGHGFFEVQLPSGDLRYRRDGRFRMDFHGRVVTNEGYPLTDQMAIPEDCLGVSVSPDGQVFAQLADNQTPRIGEIRLHTFRAEDRLIPSGGTLFAATVASGPATSRQPGVQGAGQVKQGYLEGSNVHLTDEIVALQLVERQAAAIRQALAGHGVFVP